jgi:hypothetical protein
LDSTIVEGQVRAFCVINSLIHINYQESKCIVCFISFFFALISNFNCYTLSDLVSFRFRYHKIDHWKINGIYIFTLSLNRNIINNKNAPSASPH